MGPSSTHNWGNNQTNALHKFPLNSSQENVSYFNGPGLTSLSNLPRGREGEEGGGNFSEKTIAISRESHNKSHATRNKLQQAPNLKTK